MKKIELLLLFFFAGITCVFSQVRSISGKITDKDGNPVSFASVTLLDTKTGISADVNGTFTLKVKNGDVLHFTASGFSTLDVTISSQNSLSVMMEKSSGNSLREVVVSGAYGIRRTAKSTTANIQSITGEQLNTARQSNINNAIAGKVAGAQVRSQSAVALGRETLVRLRGENSLGVGGGALYVVDGTILPSGGDVNADDVEDISVLQGPAGSALFGPDGANGVIVVTTKKGKRNALGNGIEVNTAIVYDKVYILPDYQNTYAGGSGPDLIQYNYRAGDPEGWKALDGKWYHNYDDDASWGPRMMGQEYIPWYAWSGGHERSFKTALLTPQPNNARDFFNTGVTKTTNVNFSRANEFSNFRLSYTNLDIKGLMPNSYMKRHTFNMSFSYDITPKLTVSSDINFITQNRNSESNDGYSNGSSGSFNQWFHRDLDIDILRQLRGLKTPGGVYYSSWNISNPTSYSAANPDAFYKGNYWFNPYTQYDLQKNYDQRNRLFGNLALSYKLTNALKVKATYRRQQLTANGYNIYPTEMQLSTIQSGFNPYAETTAEGILAAYKTGQSSNIRQNFEGLLTYDKKFRNFSVMLNAGFDILKSNERSFNANTSGGLTIPNVYSLANSVNPIRNAGAPDNNGQFEVITEFTRRALLANLTLGYRNLLFVEGTYRRDHSSTEPKGSYIETKSVGASLIISDLLPGNNVLSYAKLRGSYGQVLNTLSPYNLNNYYTISNNVNGNAILGEPNTLINPELHGASNSEKELGLELRFWKNRFGISGTYWDRTNKDFPVSITLSGASGYTAYRTNAGEVAKKGVDVQAFLEVIRSKNFNWRLTGTWGTLIENKVVSLDKEGQIKSLISSGGAFSPAQGSSTRAAWVTSQVGETWGMLTGTGIKRINGVPVIDDNGLYVAENNVKYGSVLPNYTGGVQSSINFLKNFTFNVNVDYSVGGKYFSLSDYWGSFSGLTAKTAVLNDKGNSIRDAIEDGGGVHVFGVDGTGKAIDKYVDAQTYFHQFNGSNISEASVYDLTFVKMREVSLGYKLPMDKLGIGRYIKGATFSVIARNPILIYAKTRDFDPSEISNVAGEDGQFPGTRSLGFNIKLNF
jgi:TonB-linked SusC/RagA family outer membrane protein